MNKPSPHRDADAKPPPNLDKPLVAPPQAPEAPPPQDTQHPPDAGNAGLSWLRARNAAREAWRRVDG